MNYLNQVGNSLIDLYEEAKKIAQDKLGIYAVIPFFYSKSMMSRGEKHSFSYWIQKTVDETVLMAYRDSAEGIKKISIDHVQKANIFGKKIILAVETKPLKDYHVSFYGISNYDLKKELDSVNTALKGMNGYGGQAIHAYQYFNERGCKEKVIYGQKRSLFIWENVAEASDKHEIIKKVNSWGFNQVYLHVNPNSFSDRNKWSNFYNCIKEFEEAGINIVLLMGDPSWAYNHEYALKAVKSAVEFKARYYI